MGSLPPPLPEGRGEWLAVRGDGLGNGIGGGPGCLEIEASCDAIDVEHLASEIEMRHMLAL